MPAKPYPSEKTIISCRATHPLCFFATALWANGRCTWAVSWPLQTCRYYSTLGLSARPASTQRLNDYVATSDGKCQTDGALSYKNPEPSKLAKVAVQDAERSSACAKHPDHCFCGSHLSHWSKSHFTQFDYEERCHNCTTATTTLTTTATSTPTTTPTATPITTPTTTATSTQTTTADEPRCGCDQCIDCDETSHCGCVETFDTTQPLLESELFRPETDPSTALAHHNCNAREGWSYAGKKVREVGVHQYTRASVVTKKSKAIHFQDQCLYVLAGSVYHDTGVSTTYNHNFDVNFDVVLLDGHQFPGIEVKIWFGPANAPDTGELLGEALFATETDLATGGAGGAGIPAVKKASLSVSVGNVSVALSVRADASCQRGTQHSARAPLRARMSAAHCTHAPTVELTPLPIDYLPPCMPRP